MVPLRDAIRNLWLPWIRFYDAGALMSGVGSLLRFLRLVVEGCMP